MALSKSDLESIREIIREEQEALENDVKDIYKMISKTNRKIKKINHTMEDGFRRTHANFSAIAGHLNVEMPYSHLPK